MKGGVEKLREKETQDLVAQASEYKKNIKNNDQLFELF